VTAGDEIVFQSGSASITIKKDGTIELKGVNISVEGQAVTTVKGGLVKINS
jgi:type VI secretion system secreted protein VgrG